MSNIDYLLSDINNINGVGSKTGNLFKKKNINTIFDLLWNLPRDFVDRTTIFKINELEVGKIKTNLIAQLTSPVKWTQSINQMIKDGTSKFIEIGPGNVLQGLIKKIDRNSEFESGLS